VANSLNNLAGCDSAEGLFPDAEGGYAKVVEIRCRTLPSAHPATATALNNLGYAQMRQEKFQEARVHLTEARDMKVNTMGEQDGENAGNLRGLAACHIASGESEVALPLVWKAITIEEDLLLSALSLGSETQRMDWLDRFRETVADYLSLVVSHFADD